MAKKQSKDPTKAVFSFLSAAFFLILLDVVIIHPFGDIAALILLLAGCYQIGMNGKVKGT